MQEKRVRTKALALAFAVLISGVAVSAQVVPNSITSKPLPTLQQCRADLDAWSKIDPVDDSKSMLTHDDLQEMAIEMSRCGFAVDLKNNAKYTDAFKTIYSCESGRYFDFIRRHNGLWNQFENEDKAGAR